MIKRANGSYNRGIDQVRYIRKKLDQESCLLDESVRTQARNNRGVSEVQSRSTMPVSLRFKTKPLLMVSAEITDKRILQLLSHSVALVTYTIKYQPWIESGFL